MKWRKLGRVHVASAGSGWACSHAFLPVAHRPSAELIRLYVAFLDRERIGRVGYVDVRHEDVTRPVRVSERPVLDVGRRGTFDEHGVTPTALVERGGTLYLYYAGWQRAVGVRYFLFTGLAASDDGGESFTRVSEAPVLDRSDGELLVRTGAWVTCEGGLWRAWYAGGNDWIRVGETDVPAYDMRYAESPDGIRWPRRGRVCMSPVAPDEYGFGRPCVSRRADGGYAMWYSIRTRSRGYRIGYATSADGIDWRRRDELAGIDVSESGWDSEMVCFPAVVETPQRTYMFYNGNNYGETGVGAAVLED